MKIAFQIAMFSAVYGTSFGDEAQLNAITAFHEVTFDRSEKKIHISLAVFAEKQFDLRVISNAGINDNPRFESLEKAMSSLGCVAGCNGGFFNRHPFEPVGLLLTDGQSAGKFDPASWMSGLLVIRRDRISLEPANSYTSPPTDAVSVLQSGSWLVQDGHSEMTMDNRRLAPRTFICHDGHGLWAIGASEECTLHELATALRGSALIKILDVKYALNLDGGPSTGLWVKIKGGAIVYLREQWPVRDYVGIIPK